MADCKRCGATCEFPLEDHCDWCTARLEEIAAEKASKPKRHTYINTLQETVALQEARIHQLEEREAEIVSYLGLPKFAEPESWVSKYDILRMLGHF